MVHAVMGWRVEDELERSELEAERQPASELEIGRGPDPAVENVAGLRDEDAEQTVADVGGGEVP